MSAGEGFFGDPLGPDPLCLTCDDTHVIVITVPPYLDRLSGDVVDGATSAHPCPDCCRRDRQAVSTLLAAATVARRIFLNGATRG